MRRFFLILFLLICVLAIALIIRTFQFKSQQINVDPVRIQVDAASVAEHLAGAVRFQTISHQDPSQLNPREFTLFHEYLQTTFPAAHKLFQREIIGDLSLLYTWQGKDPKAKPLLFLSHMDVVPVEADSEQSWTQPPFEGRIADGFIWGRGTLDDKVTLTAILEAAEKLAGEGFQPDSTIYFAFGHDEENGGEKGAAKIAALLAARGLTFEFALDEGAVITDGMLEELTSPVAVIAIAEKGYLSLELTVETEGGHSSMPPQETAVGILSEAITKLEKNQMKTRLNEPVQQMFQTIAPEIGFFPRMVFANLWLFEGLVKNRLESEPATNALIRSTVVATVIQAGTKDNVLPHKARAVVNIRINPGDSMQSAMSHVSHTVDDSRVKVSRLNNKGSEPSTVSSTEAPSYRTLQQTIRQVFPDVIVAPTLLMGGTDSRHYIRLTPNIYRFAPLVLRREDLRRVHGMNERISVANYAECVKFYYQLIRNASS